MKKVALVTGGNSGIGFAVAALLVAKNYDVTIVGRDTERTNEAATRLGVTALVADMSKPEDVQKIISHFAEKPLDVLVNNAGTANFLPLDATTRDDFARLMGTNAESVYFLIQGLLPSLRLAKGSISNVSSAVVTSGVAAASAYAASKGAIDAMVRSLALELAPQGIRINAVAPGAIDTPIHSKYGIPPEIIEGMKAHMVSTIPLARFGTSEEVASVVVAQLESAYVTGCVWAVDGGIGAK